MTRTKLGLVILYDEADQEIERCASMAPHGTLQCERSSNHDGIHVATIGRGRARRWGVSEVGCPDPDCQRGPHLDYPHRDGDGRSWWPNGESGSVTSVMAKQSAG